MLQFFLLAWLPWTFLVCIADLGLQRTARMMFVDLFLKLTLDPMWFLCLVLVQLRVKGRCHHIVSKLGGFPVPYFE